MSDTKSATCSALQSTISPVGLMRLSLLCVKVVGVCSVLSGPELVGELSYSTGIWSRCCHAVRSNSSSASESSWYLDMLLLLLLLLLL